MTDNAAGMMRGWLLEPPDVATSVNTARRIQGQRWVADHEFATGLGAAVGVAAGRQSGWPAGTGGKPDTRRDAVATRRRENLHKVRKPLRLTYPNGFLAT